MGSRPAAREAPILRGCQELLKLRGFPYWRMNSGALVNPKGRPVRFGFPGCPDLWSLVPPSGRLLAIEAKAPGGKPTEAQWAVLGAIRAAGGVSLVVSDLATLDRALGRLAARPDARLDFGGEEEST
jgi:hypothetical protein